MVAFQFGNYTYQIRRNAAIRKGWRCAFFCKKINHGLFFWDMVKSIRIVFPVACTVCGTIIPCSYLSGFIGFFVDRGVLLRHNT